MKVIVMNSFVQCLRVILAGSISSNVSCVFIIHVLLDRSLKHAKGQPYNPKFIQQYSLQIFACEDIKSLL